MSEEKTIQLKVDEEAVKKEEEEEEVEQEEAEGNEEEEQKNKNQGQNEGNENQGQNGGQNKIELRQEDDDEEEAVDVEENDNNRIVLQDEKNKAEYYLSNEIKVNVEWVIDDNENVDILFCTNTQKKLVLHWGVSNANSQGKWSHIDSLYPPLSKDFDDFAIQTDFSYLEDDNTQQKIRIKFPKDDVSSLNFVFLERDSNTWYNNGNKDYHINLN